MNRDQIFSQIKIKRSYLCIGLDTDISKIPSHLLEKEDPVFEFNREIIEATHDLCVAYKPNLAFYESMGSAGWKSLEKTMQLVPDNIFTIADAKRGDIGNTSTLYAKAFFNRMNFDAVTVAPYMGMDSVTPFLDFPGKWVILLALTSNPGAKDFQMLDVKYEDGENALHEIVINKSMQWGSSDNMMYVTGATRAEQFNEIRKLIPDHFLLVPGIGAQGGNLEEVSLRGFNNQCGLLVNSSRQIIYAGNGKDFAQRAREEAKSVQMQMQVLLEKAELV